MDETYYKLAEQKNKLNNAEENMVQAERKVGSNFENIKSQCEQKLKYAENMYRIYSKEYEEEKLKLISMIKGKDAEIEELRNSVKAFSDQLMAETQARTKCEEEMTTIKAQLEGGIRKCDGLHKIDSDYFPMPQYMKDSEGNLSGQRVRAVTTKPVVTKSFTVRQGDGRSESLTPGFASSREKAPGSSDYNQGESQINRQELEWEIADILRVKEAEQNQLIKQYEDKIDRIKEIASSELASKTTFIKEELSRMKLELQESSMEKERLQHQLELERNKIGEVKYNYEQERSVLISRFEDAKNEIEYYKGKLADMSKELERSQIAHREFDMEMTKTVNKINELSASLQDANKREIIMKRTFQEHIERLERDLMGEQRKSKNLQQERLLYEDDMFKRKQEIINSLQSIDLQSLQGKRFDESEKENNKEELYSRLASPVKYKSEQPDIRTVEMLQRKIICNNFCN